MEPDWKGRIAAAGVGDHHDGVADAYFRVHDLAVGRIEAAERLGVEGLLQEVDDGWSAVRDDVDRDSVVSVGLPIGVHCGLLVGSLQQSLRKERESERVYPAVWWARFCVCGSKACAKLN